MSARHPTSKPILACCVAYAVANDAPLLEKEYQVQIAVGNALLNGHKFFRVGFAEAFKNLIFGCPPRNS